jgi:plastocyanin
MRMGRVLQLGAAISLLAGSLAIGVSPVGAASPRLTITADMPGAVPAGHNWGFNDFFPRSLTVHKGQTIQFVLQGFHTATLLPKGAGAVADLKANGIAAADAEDTTANPGGQTHTQLRVPAIMPTSFTCGTPPLNPCSFTGATVVSSGAPLGPGAPAPFVVTINAPVGVYTLLCRIHPGMTATIRVAPASAPVTTAKALAASVKSQIASDVKEGWLAEKQASVVSSSTLPDGHTLWMVNVGASSPSRHVTILEFLPGTLTVQPGDLVTWTSPAANEIHTVTFPTDLHTDQVPLCEDASTGTDTPATPLHTPPQGPTDFSCGTAPGPEIEFAPGNGVRTLADTTTVSDSGVLASAAARAAWGLPASAALSTWTIGLSATAPAGKYTFVCQVHAGMTATLVIH